MTWHALFVESGKEELVQTYLELNFKKSNLLSIIPKRKVPEKKGGVIKHVKKKLFPGYILIQTNMDRYTYNKIRNIPKIHRVLNTGVTYSTQQGFYITKLEDNEINFISELLNEDGIIEYSQVCINNSIVDVISGPLFGMEHLIRKVDKRKNRAKLQFDIRGKEMKFEVGIEISNN
ncbi:transcriptional antiterminator NusG [Gracilibacillus orientalis]|uniref:Transcription termination/antitermination protein NusG n=1 Tax=Gracilibacillus orientalis TaxID=334253 RepID=A0A1I4H8I3_9BACI|nr:antiterminator LoaP [Gracilibacillus orientalis]SFL37721.1 transcriptional antiterminator NusG [Gracilibacillus orientalis]